MDLAYMELFIGRKKILLISIITGHFIACFYVIIRLQGWSNALLHVGPVNWGGHTQLKVFPTGTH
jgi:hypothetical protein